MKKHLFFLAAFVLMFLLTSFLVAAEEARNNPVTVSPGSETEIVTVWQSCPTFSWSSVEQAASYMIAIFEVVDSKVTAYEDMVTITSPVIIKNIGGPALSWTLSSEESLKTEKFYAWYVQAVDAFGNAISSWSNGRIFKVNQEIRFAGIEEKLGEILKSYGVNDETTANVLKDMKSEVKEVVVQSAGSKNTPGVNRVQGYEGETNTFYGLSAGASITSGLYNTFIGQLAGNANTIGYYNAIFGQSAGFNNTSGGSNTFIGQIAGYSNTTGDSNTFLGRSAGYSNTSGYDNDFLGSNAGYSNTTGCSNIFIGAAAGYNNTTANHNIFLGKLAGANNSTGYDNTFLGSNSGYSNTTGSQNTFVGKFTGYTNTTGNENAFIGFNAGFTNTTGYANTFFGFEAGKLNTTGSNNTFLGKAAGSSTTTGETNVFIGSAAGLSNTTGFQNVFVGRSAGNFNLAGNANTFLGANAGFHNTDGVSNTFLGYATGNTNSTGNNNTAIGFFAGFSNTSGQGNVFLGYNAGYNETGSHKLYIANSETSSPLIYGEFDNSLLKVNGNLRVTGYLSLDNGATQINSTEINLLHGKTSVSTGSTDNDKFVTKGYVDENDDVGGGGLTGNEMTDSYLCKWDDANTRLVDSLISESPGIIKMNGKLGIGTAEPIYPIEVDTTGSNSCILVKRTDGASNYINATDAYANFGSTSNHPLRLVVNSAWKMRLNQDGSVIMSNGASLTTGGVWTNASSRALKENIENLSAGEALEALNKLNPVKYNYKIDKADKHVGFIAEDVPELVATSDRKGLSPMDITAVLTKVVQGLRRENREQRDLLQEQHNSIREYKKIISDLQERVAALEKK